MIISKEKILKESRDLVASEGLDALSIRKLAKKCDLWLKKADLLH